MPDLFRAEALAHRAATTATGGQLPPPPAWTGHLYWLLLVLVATGVVAAWCVRVDGDRLITVLLGSG